MSFFHEVIETSLITVAALFIILLIKNKFLDRFFPNSRQRNELERNYLDTLKDLQDLKFALDEANLVQVVDKTANILYANEKFCRLSEYSFKEIKGQNMRILNSSYHSKEFFKELWATVSQGKVWSGEIRNKTKSGKYYWTFTTIVPFLDKQKKPFQYIVIRNDITKSKELEKQLEYLSNVDGLTALFNRRYFDKMLESYWQALGASQDPLSMILFDVDYFKCYNDHYGHLLGDQCLIDISNRVKDIMNPYEAICARYGGEEFAIILPKKDVHESRFLAERIRLEIEKLHIPHEWSKQHGRVTMSFGVASLVPAQDRNPMDLLNLADKALYQAKNNGRNTVV
ncbi:MAG: diguanylate cyclase [Bacillus sp. (in: firmicutes)]